MHLLTKIRSWIGYLKAFLLQKLLRPLMYILAKINYPGQENINLLDIGTFFVVGIQKGDIQARARSISFDFFLAIFPAIIFFFTLIPYFCLYEFYPLVAITVLWFLPHHPDTAFLLLFLFHPPGCL